jgi:hypothetical protein
MSRLVRLRWPLAVLLALAACKTQPSVATSDPEAAPSIAPSASSASSSDSEDPIPDVAPPLSDNGAQALHDDGVRRRSDLMLNLGGQPKGEWVEDTFYVLSTEPSAPFDAAVAQTRAMVAALWHNHHFSHRLDHAVSIWVFASTQEMIRAVLQFSPGVRTDVIGVSDDNTHTIFFATQPAGLTTGNHEQCHPMIAADFPRSEPHHWLREGFCALFEAADVSASGEMHFNPHFRINTLRDRLADPKTAAGVKIASLFGMSNDDFGKDEPLHYALAREMMRFLSTRGNQLWDWYHAWREGVLTDPTGEKAFQAVTGRTPEQMDGDGEFVAWVMSPGAAAR